VPVGQDAPDTLQHGLQGLHGEHPPWVNREVAAHLEKLASYDAAFPEKPCGAVSERRAFLWEGASSRSAVLGQTAEIRSVGEGGLYRK
jgi:hypothetical protein